MTILVTGVEDPLHYRLFMSGCRTNVGLTRAKAFSFVIGQADCFKCPAGASYAEAPQDMQDLIQWHEDRHSIIHLDPASSTDIRDDILHEYEALARRNPALVHW